MLDFIFYASTAEKHKCYNFCIDYKNEMNDYKYTKYSYEKIQNIIVD